MRCQRRSKHRVASVLVASLVLLGCSHGPKPPATAHVTSTSLAPPTTKSTPPTPQPKLIFAHTFTPAQQAVAQGYFAAVRRHLEASENPTVPPTHLAESYSGAMLAVARKDIDTLAARREAVRLPADTKSIVRIDRVRIQGVRAIVDLCTVDDAITYSQRGGVVVDSTVVSHKRHATLALTAGQWKLLFRTSDPKQHGSSACVR